MRRTVSRTDLPEKLQYTKYYEYDGMLRAYANRAMVMAFAFAAVAVASLGFAIYVRIQPPTIIRVSADGQASVVRAAAEGADSPTASSPRIAEGVTEATSPTELEARAAVRSFLEHYLAYTPGTVDQNLARALGMMTVNLRAYTLGRLRDEDVVGEIKADRIISQLSIRTIEAVDGMPWTFVAFGVKEVHRVRQGTESTDRIVARYNVRLVEDRRSETNPSGLLVAEFSEQQMVGERDGGLLQRSQILGEEQ